MAQSNTSTTGVSKIRRWFIRILLIITLVIALMACSGMPAIEFSINPNASPTEQPFFYSDVKVYESQRTQNIGGDDTTQPQPATAVPDPFLTPDTGEGLYLVSLYIGENVMIDSRYTDSENQVVLAVPREYEGRVGTITVQRDDQVLFTYHRVIGRDSMAFEVNPNGNLSSAVSEPAQGVEQWASEPIAQPTPQILIGQVSKPTYTEPHPNHVTKSSIFAEGFTNNQHGWALGQFEWQNSATNYELKQDQLRQTATFYADGTVILTNIPTVPLQNFEIAFDVDMKANSTADPINLMTIIRQNNNGDYYAITFSNNGRLSARLWQNQRWVSIVDQHDTPLIKQGTGNTNRYTITAVDQSITVKINGQEALQFTADVLTTPGRLKFGLEGYQNQTISIAIDNLTITTIK